MKKFSAFLLFIVLLTGSVYWWRYRVATPDPISPESTIERSRNPEIEGPPSGYLMIPDEQAEYSVNGRLVAPGSRVDSPAGDVWVTALAENRYWQKSVKVGADSEHAVKGEWIPAMGSAETATYQSDLFRRGHVSAGLLSDQPTVVWDVNLGEAVRSDPIVNHQHLYLATRRHQVVALHTASGSMIWQGAAIESDTTNAVTDEYVFAANDRGSLDAYRVKDGKRKGDVGLGSFATSLTVLPQGLLTITADGSLYMLKTERSLFGNVPLKEAWTSEVEALMDQPSQPVVAHNRCLVQTGSGGLLAFDLDSGETLWSHGAVGGAGGTEGNMTLSFVGEERRGTSTPATDSQVVVAGLGNQLVCLDWDGSVLWQKTLDGKVTTSVSLAYGMAFVGLTNGSMLAVSLQDGSRIWRKGVSKGAIYAAPVISGNRLLVVDKEGKLKALHALNGELLWERSDLTGESIYATPAISLNGLFVVCESGRVICYR